MKTSPAPQSVSIAGEADADLQQVIEPLASYLCATDRPRTALRQALAVLVRQIEQTNRSAASHATFLENRLAVPA